MAFIPELEGRPIPELLTFLDTAEDGVGGVPEDELPLWLDEAARRIGESGAKGLEELLRRVTGPGDAPRLASVLLGLSFVPREALAGRRDEVRGALLARALGASPHVAARAIDALRHLEYREAQGQILPLLEHGSPYVVGSVLRYLSTHAPDIARPLLLKALNSPEPVIRSNAIDELDGLDCVEALPRLRALLTDPDENVRQAAQTAVENLEAVR